MYKDFNKYSSLIVPCVRIVNRTLAKVSRSIILRHFWPLLNQASFFEAAGATTKIVSTLKPNHNGQVMLALIPDTHDMLFQFSYLNIFCGFRITLPFTFTQKAKERKNGSKQISLPLHWTRSLRLGQIHRGEKNDRNREFEKHIEWKKDREKEREREWSNVKATNKEIDWERVIEWWRWGNVKWR